MKRFKIGFLAVVALLAMSFTIINQNESVKIKTTTVEPPNALEADLCYQTLYECVLDNAVVATDPDPGECVIAAGDVTFDNIECGAVPGNFCCFKIESQTEEECPTCDDFTDAYEIEAIWNIRE